MGQLMEQIRQGQASREVPEKPWLSKCLHPQEPGKEKCHLASWASVLALLQQTLRDTGVMTLSLNGKDHHTVLMGGKSR